MNKNPILLNQAVILAGGRGERLRPLTDRIPKPMVSINGVPFLDYLINSVIQAGIRRILILTGYKGDVIVDSYRDSLEDEKIEIEYSRGPVEDETGKRIADAHALLDNHFLLLYGDNYWPIELDEMLALYEARGRKVLTTAFSNKDGTGEYGYENNIQVDEHDFVRKYDKKKKSPGLNAVDIGYFIMNKKIVKECIKDNVSFEESVLPKLIAKQQLVAHVTDTQYYYITDANTLKNFESITFEKNISPVLRKKLKEIKK